MSLFKAATLFFVFAFIAVILGISAALTPYWFAPLLLMPLFLLLYLNTEFRFVWAERAVRFLLPVYFFLTAVWPRYLCVKIPGPDLTPTRLVLILLVLLWLVALYSRSYKQQMIDDIKANAGFIAVFTLFVVWRGVTAITSDYPFNSLYLFINEAVSAYLILFVFFSAVTKWEDVNKILRYLVVGSLIILLVGIVEKIRNANPIELFVPPGLRLSNEFVEQAIQAKVRGGAYRVESVFSHPLLLVEYIAFILPLLGYMLIAAKSYTTRITAALAAAGLIVLSIFTGSRSAIVSLVLVLGMTGVMLVLRWVKSGHLNKIVYGVTFAIPILILTGVIIVEYFGINSSLISGRTIDEMQSSQARVEMLRIGMPKIMDRPVFGYGTGLAAFNLGFAASHGGVTIDNFYLSLALDSGLPIFVLFVGLSAMAILKGVKAKDDEDVSLLSTLLAVSIVGILAVKSILSINCNLPFLILVFAMLYKIQRMKSNA